MARIGMKEIKKGNNNKCNGFKLLHLFVSNSQRQKLKCIRATHFYVIRYEYYYYLLQVVNKLRHHHRSLAI